MALDIIAAVSAEATSSTIAPSISEDILSPSPSGVGGSAMNNCRSILAGLLLLLFLSSGRGHTPEEVDDSERKGVVGVFMVDAPCEALRTNRMSVWRGNRVGILPSQGLGFNNVCDMKGLLFAANPTSLRPSLFRV